MVKPIRSIIAITQDEYEALKSTAATVETDKDVEYTTETLFDDEDREIAWASFHAYDGAGYKRHAEPRPRAQYDEDGNQIEVGG